MKGNCYFAETNQAKTLLLQFVHESQPEEGLYLNRKKAGEKNQITVHAAVSAVFNPDDYPLSH